MKNKLWLRKSEATNSWTLGEYWGKCFVCFFFFLFFNILLSAL